MDNDHALVLELIRACIRAGRFTFTSHALTKHPPQEGFTPAQALAAIENGAIVEEYGARERYLICGEARGVPLSRDYVSTYIHCVCQYVEDQDIVIITMYRPRSDQWINQFTRRR